MHAVYMPFGGRQKDEDSPGEPASLRMHSRRALPPVSEALLEAGSAPRDVLPAVARHLADSLRDACVIRLAAGAGVSTDAVALYHRDPVALALLAELRAAQPRLWADAFNAQVLQSGEPVMLATVPADLLRLWVHPDFGRYLQQFSLSSILVVPLHARRAIVGTLCVWRDGSAAPYAEGDLNFLQEVAEWLAPWLTILCRGAGESGPGPYTWLRPFGEVADLS